jgi:hypothetical protein
MVYFGFRSFWVICPNYLEFKQEMREAMHVTRCPSRWIIHRWQLEDLFGHLNTHTPFWFPIRIRWNSDRKCQNNPGIYVYFCPVSLNILFLKEKSSTLWGIYKFVFSRREMLLLCIWYIFVFISVYFFFFKKKRKINY